MTKIDIVSGFLGAGKTTLIKKLIAEGFNGEKLVLIENEFGEIGIDGGFLKDSGIEITEMNSGCICCSLVGDFGTALKEVLDKYSPDRVIIEPSGVGKLSDVIKAVKGIDAENIKLNSLVAVVDAVKCKMFMKNFGEFFNNQIESAKTIVLSRTDKLNEDKLEACVSLIREHNEGAAVITTPWDRITGKVILEAMENNSGLEQELIKEANEHRHEHGEGHHHEHGECCHDHEEGHHHEHGECCHSHEESHHHEHGECCHNHDEKHRHGHGEGHECCEHEHHHGHHHHADEVFTSFGTETPKKFSKEALEEALKALSETTEYGVILRAKGILESKDNEWLYFDLVPGEYEIRSGEPDYTGRLCVIGTELKTEKIEKLFELK